MRHSFVLASSLLAATSALAAAQPGAAATQPRGADQAAAAARADTNLAMGSFVSSRIDEKKLPVHDLVTDDRGTQYLIEFDELILTLKANGEFRAALRYRQTLAPKGGKTTQEPIARMTVVGTWTREGSTIRFIPDPKRGGEGLNILAGTFTARTITVPFDYRNGRVQRRSTVLLILDPSIL